MTTGGLGRARGAAGNQSFIRDQMKSYILERGLKAGDPLPNEQELMAQLGVGRHPLREAMKALQAVGIIEIRHGYGTYVGEVSLQSLEDGLAFRMSQSMAGDLRDVQNVLEVRQAIEVGLADDVVAYFSSHGYDDPRADRRTDGSQGRRRQVLPRRGLGLPPGALRAARQRPGHRPAVSVFWRTFSQVDARLPGARYSPADAAAWHRDLLNYPANPATPSPSPAP